MPLTRASAASAERQRSVPPPHGPNDPPRSVQLINASNINITRTYHPTESTHLSVSALALLHTKQTSLQSLSSCEPSSLFVGSTRSSYLQSVPPDHPTAEDAFRHLWRSTYVFAREDAGTAVCISSDGRLLTCAHCIAEDEEEAREIRRELKFEAKARSERRVRIKEARRWWLLSGEGRAVRAYLLAWDERRDLALLKVDGLHSQPVTQKNIHEFQRKQNERQALRKKRRKEGVPEEEQDSRENSAEMHQNWLAGLPHLEVPKFAPVVDTPLVCIGHPGSEDFEADRPGVATDYPVLCASAGRFRGYARGQNKDENTEIGSLMHDCWTYWGHSGAPLVTLVDRDEHCGRLPNDMGWHGGLRLVGLHSSWDEETGMRRGIGVETIKRFRKGLGQAMQNLDRYPFLDLEEWVA